MFSELPHYAQIEISMVHCFSFQLPIEAVGIKENGIIEIVVEFGQDGHNDTLLTANVWARRPGDIISGFIHQISLPFVPNEEPLKSAGRICDLLNMDDNFVAQLGGFWKTISQMKM